MRASYSLIAIALLVAGCSNTRSISDSGYKHESSYCAEPAADALYKGELSEFDVLGIDPSTPISEGDIADALANAGERKTLRKGDDIMLIQSGAMIPDEQMVLYLQPTFSISAFSGVPTDGAAAGKGTANALRLAAAKSGIETIVVYWGILESGTEDLVTKTVSWVPVVGFMLPDESQVMRIKLKLAVIDVKTGRWDAFSPNGAGDNAWSAWINREAQDQAQVAKLKEAAYRAAADALIARYVQ